MLTLAKADDLCRSRLFSFLSGEKGSLYHRISSLDEEVFLDGGGVSPQDKLDGKKMGVQGMQAYVD